MHSSIEHSYRTIILAVLMLGAAFRAESRIDFRVTHAGQPLVGAEVCFFPAPSRPVSLADTIFHSGDVTCLSADLLLELPAGTWLYFARHREGFTSDYRPMVSMPRDEPPENYRTVHEAVVPAAKVNVTQILPTLKSSERLVVLAESRHAGTIVLPLVAGEDTILVPAGATFVVGIVEDHRLIRLGPAMKLAPAESVRIRSLPKPRDGMHDVTAWISIPTVIREKSRVEFVSLEVPRVQLIANGQAFEPIFKVTNSAALAEALLVFKDVPRVSGSVLLDGDLWVRDEILSMGSDAVELIEEPLSTEPAAAIRITTTLPAARDRTCDTTETAASVTLLSCASDAADSCAVLQSVPVQRDQSVTLGGLRGGPYVVEFDPGVAGAKQRRNVHGDVGTVANLAIDPAYFSFHGNVLLGGKPVPRMLDFWRRGTTISDAVDGKYAVTLAETPPPPMFRSIRVVNCDDEGDVYMHVATDAPKQGERFDIVIPDNSIGVELREAGGTDGLAGVVRLAAYENDASDSMRFGRSYSTDASGNVTITHVTTEAPLSICGEAEGYETRCVSRFRMGASDDRHIKLDLSRKARGSRGHLAAPAPIEDGRLWWVSNRGAITESVEVQPNGDFLYERTHTPHEHIVIASATQPLAVLSSPVTEADTRLDLVYPTTPRRSISVRLNHAGVKQAALGLIIGTVNVPTAAFAYHQELRGEQFVVDESTPLRIHDVQGSAPITIVLGPDGPSALAHLPPGTDFMSVDAYVLSRPRQTVSEAGEVTFRH